VKLYARRGYEWAEDGLAGLWSPVTTGATGLTILDSALQSNNHGSPTGFTDANTPWRGSVFGTETFIATNTFWNCGTAPQCDFTGPFSVMAWVRNNTANDTSFISKISSLTTPAYRGWALSSNFSNGRLQAFWGNAIRATSAKVVSNVARYQLLGMRWTGSLCEVFIDGIVDGSGAVTAAPNSTGTPLYLGQYDFNGGTGRSMNGGLAEGCCFNRALSHAEFYDAFQAGPGGMWQDRPRRSRAYFGAAGFKAYWARRQSQLIGGGV
jgi:hypothetical protein